MDRDRTADSIEQLEDAELKNPITDDDIALGDPGEALDPEDQIPAAETDDDAGPAPRTTQMPR